MAESSWAGDEWLTAVRWSATLVEPLIPLRTRQQLESDLERTATDHEMWGVLFFAGVVSDLVSSLPAADPWRTIRLVDGQAVIDGRPFGTLQDHLDLIPSISPDPSIDVALAAVIDPVPSKAAAFVAAAFDGRAAAVAHLDRVSSVPGEVYEVGAEAVRLLVFRRRCMMGPLDSFSVDSCWWWSEQAYRLEVGETDAETVEGFSDERMEFEVIPEDHYVPDRTWVEERSSSFE